jgi:xylulokinase
MKWSDLLTVVADEPVFRAGLLAAAGTGAYRNVQEACKAAIEVTRTIRPRPRSRRLYAGLHEQYQRLYPALKDEFVRIARLSGE